MRCLAWIEEDSQRCRCPGAGSVIIADQSYCAYHAEQLTRAVLAGGRVYFMQRDGLVKIGVSHDPERRAEQLTARLLATEPGGRARERTLHRRFALARVSGEWFTPTQELVDHFSTLADQWSTFVPESRAREPEAASTRKGTGS